MSQPLCDLRIAVSPPALSLPSLYVGQASAATSASMAPPPTPHSPAAPSATDDESLQLMLSQESNQSFFTAGKSATFDHAKHTKQSYCARVMCVRPRMMTFDVLGTICAGRSVTSAPAADAMEVDEQAAQPDEEKVEKPRGKDHGRKKKEEVEEEEEAMSTAAVAGEEEEQDGAEEAGTTGRGRKRKGEGLPLPVASSCCMRVGCSGPYSPINCMVHVVCMTAAPTKPAVASGGAGKKGKVTAPTGGRRGKAKAPEPAKEDKDGDEEEEESEDEAAAAAVRCICMSSSNIWI